MDPDGEDCFSLGAFPECAGSFSTRGQVASLPFGRAGGSTHPISNVLADEQLHHQSDAESWDWAYKVGIKRLQKQVSKLQSEYVHICIYIYV